MNVLESVVVEARGPQRATVIWLHGLGADGHDFEAIVPELGLADELGIRFIFPHAPQRPVTINQGYVMRAWYDIHSMTINEQPDRTGILQSVADVTQLITVEQTRGIAADKIIIAGFSQGGVIAMHTALRFEQRLAGIMSLSSYLPLEDELATECATVNRQTPIFLAHGTQDPVVPYALGVAERRWLKDLDYPVQWHEYEMQHSVCMEEVADIAQWIRACLNNN